MFRKLFKRKAKPVVKKRRRLPERKLAPVTEIAEQGLMLANVAARMNVKNEIIMNALSKNIDYNPEQINTMVRTKLEELSAERAKDADHIKRVRDEIRQYGRSAWQETEYGNDDMRTLKHRQEVYAMLADKLKAEAADEEFVRSAAREAMDLAWAEIADSLKNKAEHPYYGGGGTAEYKRERESRIQDLIDGELKTLIKTKKKRRR